MNTLVVLQQMTVLFIIMMVGYVCSKISWLDKASCGKLSKLVVNVMNPMLIINGIINKETGNDYRKILLNLLLMTIYFVILIFLSFVVVRLLKIEKQKESLYRLMMIFSNVGFIGIPVISSVCGETSVLYIAFYILGYNFLLYTYGLQLVGKGNETTKETTRKTKNFRAFLKEMANPGVLACLAAIMLFAFQIRVPAPVETLVAYLGEPAVPMSMILIGASMAQQSLKEMFSDIRMYLFLFIRLLVIPITAALVIGNFALDRQIAGVFVLMLAMPVGSIVVLLAAEQGVDESCCTKGSILSTLFSVATIPIVSLFL